MPLTAPEDQPAIQSELLPSPAIGLGEQQAAIQSLARQTQGRSQALSELSGPSSAVSPPALSEMPPSSMPPEPQAVSPQEAEANMPVDWENALPVKEMQRESPEAYQEAKALFQETGVLDAQGKVSANRMQHLLEKASTNPDLFQKIVTPQIKVATAKNEKTFALYLKALQKAEKNPEDYDAKQKLAEAKDVYVRTNDQRDALLDGVHAAKNKVVQTKAKLDIKLKIGQFLSDNEKRIAALSPVEQNYLKTLFATGDIDGFAEFMGDHPNILSAHAARQTAPQ